MRSVRLMAVIFVMAFFFPIASAQVHIECIINEAVTGPIECFDCATPTDEIFIKFGLRCINDATPDTVVLEGPIRAKVRSSTGDVVLYDYRQNLAGYETQTFAFNVSAASQFSTTDDVFEYIKDCSSFVVDYAGDSTVRVHWGDTMIITYPEPGMGGGGDTTYYWVLQVDGSGNDTITVGEVVNFVAGTNMSISQGLTNITFNVPNMRDTCIHTLAKLNDSTAVLYDCNGVNRGTASFTFNECMEYSLRVVNAVGSDTVFFDKCNGVKDTIVFYPPNVNDIRLDSIGLINSGDSIPFFLKDSSGQIFDTLYALIDSDSIDTDSQSLTYVVNGQFDTIGITRGNQIYLFDQDSQSLALLSNILSITRGNSVDLTPYLDNDTVYQSLAIDSTTAIWDLENDPTGPDLMPLPWKDSDADDYSANYTDPIRHNGYVGINRKPGYALDVQSSDVFNEAIGRFIKGSPGAAVLRISKQDSTQFDLMNWGSSFDIRRAYPNSGGSTDQFMRLDTTTTGRIQHYIWHDDEGYLWATDYGQGYHVPDSPDDWFYLLAPRDDGKFLEIPFTTLIDSLAPNITLDHITNLIDSIQLDSFRNLREKRKPYHITFFREDSLVSDTTAWDTLVLMNLDDRWMSLNDTLNSIALGQGARADNFYNSSLGALAFSFTPDTITESISYTQIDTQNNLITGLSTFITHLFDLGYTTGQAVTFDVELTSGEMPFIDTTTNTHAPTGLQVFVIASSSTLKPYHEYDSSGVGTYDFTASQYFTFSTAIGAMTIVDKNRQVALGDTLLEEVKIGDTIRIKADTFYAHHQLMGYDTTFGQIIPLNIDSLMAYDFAHGSVIWWDTTGGVERFQEDSANFYWDKDSSQLAIGHRDPDRRLHVQENTNTRPLIAEFEQTGPGHANIRLHPGSGESWDFSARWEDLLYIGKAGQSPLISLSGGATDGFSIDSTNLFAFENYGNGSKASHIQTFDGDGNGPVDYILGVNSNDRVKTLSFDSLAAAISVAVSNPDIDYLEYFGDTLYVHIAGQVDTAKTEILASSGGDSLGISIPADRVIIGTGTKLPTSSAALTFTSGSKLNITEVSPELKLVANLPFADGYPKITIINEFGSQVSMTKEPGVGTSLFSIINNGQIDLNSGIIGTGFQLLTTGQIKLPIYTGTTFDATPTKILNVDASGNVKTTTSAALATFLGSTISNIYNADGTLTANRKITTSDKTLTLESSTVGYPQLILNNTGASGTPLVRVQNSTNGYEFGIKSGNLNISNGTNNTLVIEPAAGSNRIYVKGTTGNVGINVTDAGQTLDVGGTLRVRSFGTGTTVTRIVGADANGVTYTRTLAQVLSEIGAEPNFSVNSGYVAYGTGTSVTGEAAFSYDPGFNELSVPEIRINSGINGYQFSVNGTAYFSGAIELDGGILDQAGNIGSSGQVLTSTGADVSWTNPTNATITLSGDVTGSGSTSIVTDISSGVVGSSELSSIGIGAGTCTTCTITVDADGRVTNYSSGAGGSGNIYTADGTVTNGATRTVTLGSGSTTILNFNDNSASNILNMNSTGSGSLTVNVDGTYGSAGSDQVKLGGQAGLYAHVGHENAAAFGSGWGTLYTISGDIEVRGNGVTVLTQGATRSITMSSSGIIMLSSSILMGATGSDRLSVETSTGYAQIRHQDASSASYLRLMDAANSSNVFLSSNNNVDVWGRNGGIARLYSSGGGSEARVYSAGGVSLGTTGTHTATVAADVEGNLEVIGTAAKTGGGSWAVLSDSTVKKEIQSIVNPYEKIMEVRPVNFRYKDEYRQVMGAENRLYHGYIAQEYMNVFPEEVKKEEGFADGLFTMSSDGVQIYTTAAVQQLIMDMEQKDAQISVLQKQILKLTERINKLDGR